MLTSIIDEVQNVDRRVWSKQDGRKDEHLAVSLTGEDTRGRLAGILVEYESSDEFASQCQIKLAGRGEGWRDTWSRVETFREKGLAPHEDAYYT